MTTVWRWGTVRYRRGSGYYGGISAVIAAGSFGPASLVMRYSFYILVEQLPQS